MKEILKIILVTQSLLFLSNGLSCSGTTPLYQNLNGVESCVNQCDSSLIEFTVDNTCKDKSMCTLYLSSDKMKCTTSCGTDYVNLYFSTSTTYKSCTQDCYSFLNTFTSNSVKYCDMGCPSNFLEKESLKTCLTNANDCGSFVDFVSNKCLEVCNESQKKIVGVLNGINTCEQCEDFFLPSTQSTKASCVKTCPAGQIGSMGDSMCHPLSDVNTACLNLKISSDQKTCNFYCPLGDILNIEGVCIAQCTTSGCSDCPDGQILDQTGDSKCISSANCSKFLSSDEKKCVLDCSHIGEYNQQNKCSKCAEGTVSYLADNGQLYCKPPEQLTNEEKDSSIQLTRALKSTFLKNSQNVKFISEKVNEQILKHYQELTSSSNIKNTFQIIEGYLKQYRNRLNYLTYQNMVQFGSSSTIMSYFELVSVTTQLKSTLNMKSLLEGSITALTEQKNKIEKETAQSVTVQIISSNPACKISGCEKFPIIQVLTQEMGGSRRRVLASTRAFTVDFTVTEASQKYICLNYNLETSEIVCPYSLPIVSNNGLTMTCELNGATQLFLDSSDIFFSRSDCGHPAIPPQIDNGGSNGISTGGIIGIVIGAIAGSILFSIGGLMLYKKLNKIKVINYDAKQSQPIPNTELVTES